VWSGYTFEFNRPSFASPAPVDMITPGVHLARGTTAGLYNAAPGKDLGYNGSGPTGTRWATSINNPGKTIAATNHAALTYTSWLAAYGPSNVGNVIVGRDAVVHLTEENIYLDLRFTNWGDGRSGGGGAFTYLRAEPPAMPTATGDYNGNGVVDAADYVLWRESLGQPAAPPGSGSDGSTNGTIDSTDYEFWRARFGNQVAGGGGQSALAAAVPEPASIVYISIVSGALALRIARRRPSVGRRTV
jgi:hypothetical protein